MKTLRDLLRSYVSDLEQAERLQARMSELKAQILKNTEDEVIVLDNVIIEISQSKEEIKILRDHVTVL